MGFFSSSKNQVRYGALIDIGSGSVLAAIIASDPSKSHPDIIWSKREQAPLRKIDAMAESARGVITALLNAFMALDGEGRRTLFEVANTQKINQLQITISAPWAYTSTKNISFQNAEPFELNLDLINELLRTANQKATEEMKEREKLHDFGLEMVVKTTLQVLANGYPVDIVGKQEANSVQVVEATAIVQERLLEAVTDTQNKLLPGVEQSLYSFMLPFYFVMLDTIEPATEFCLVDVTYEATELGIVRDGVLTYVSHTPYGAFSIAREIATILGVPLEEAYGYLSCDDLTCFTINANESQKQEIDTVLEAYQARLTKLFTDTGDALAIPKRIYLHGNLQTEAFFEHYVGRAAANATKMQHATYNVTSQLLDKRFNPEEITKLKQGGKDTALLISAQFFHTNHSRDKFTHL